MTPARRFRYGLDSRIAPHGGRAAMRFKKLNQGALRGPLRSKSAFTVATSVSSSRSNTLENSYKRRLGFKPTAAL
jgi:hypothetical protein